MAQPCDRVAPLILLKISAAKRRRYVCYAAKLTRRLILIHDLLDCKEILPNLLASQIEKNDKIIYLLGLTFPEASHSQKKVTLNLLVTSHYNYVNNHFMATKMLFVVPNLAQFLY